MSEKFLQKSAWNFFNSKVTEVIEAIFAWFLANPVLTGLDAQYITNKAPFADKLIYALESVDAHFGAKLFTKIEPTASNANILSRSSPLPSVLLSGEISIIFFCIRILF